MKRVIFLYLCLLIWPALAGPLTVEAGAVLQNVYGDNPSQTGLDGVSGLVVLTNNRIGRIKDVRVEAHFFDSDGNEVHRDEKTVTVESKSTKDVAVYWNNPTFRMVEKITGTVTYKLGKDVVTESFTILPPKPELSL